MNFGNLLFACIALLAPGKHYVNGIPDWVTEKDIEACKKYGEMNEQCSTPGAEFERKGSEFAKCHYPYRISTVKCTSPNTACQCIEEWWSTDRKCKCMKPLVPPPVFPSTGVLSWNGTEIDWTRWVWHGGSKWSYSRTPIEGTVPVSGEAHKDSMGRYLLREMRIEWKQINRAPPKATMHHTIIVPDGTGSFTKYTGNENSKNCATSTVSEEGQLNSLWKPTMWGLQYELQSEPKDKVVYTGEWKLTQMFDDGPNTWTYTVENHVKKNYGIPVRYVFENYDMGSFMKTEYDYTYKRTEGEKTFEIADYCD